MYDKHCDNCPGTEAAARITIKCEDQDDEALGPNSYTFYFCHECYHYFDKGIVPSISTHILSLRCQALAQKIKDGLGNSSRKKASRRSRGN